ncbi:unnamed protein product [Hymenolepis diminuta]|uniref:Uncharacterized protein n=1 Tax=Hymenolepis diminuta TaxID=6216 RepID=A0A564Z2E8_HYMDI|nr:unnamed protein product [Hymenolepis diminuta]
MGSNITIVSDEAWKTLGSPKLDIVPFKVFSASDEAVKLPGAMKSEATFKGKIAAAVCYMARDQRPLAERVLQATIDRTHQNPSVPPAIEWTGRKIRQHAQERLTKSERRGNNGRSVSEFPAGIQINLASCNRREIPGRGVNGSKVESGTQSDAAEENPTGLEERKSQITDQAMVRISIRPSRLQVDPSSNTYK